MGSTSSIMAMLETISEEKSDPSQCICKYVQEAGGSFFI
jgi:hypothetical protein